MQVKIFKKQIYFPKKFYWRETLAVLLLLIGIYFFHKERHEVTAIIPFIKASNKGWLAAAALVTVVFILLQAAMYIASFAAIRQRLKWTNAVELFLKRNFLSTFLPGGGVSALAYVPKSVKRAVPDKLYINQASGLFGVAGVLSTFIISIVVLLLAVASGGSNLQQTGTGMIILSAFIALLVYLLYAIRKERQPYLWLKNKYPKFAKSIYEIAGASVSSKPYALSVLASVGVEICGIAHLYISMMAVGAHPSLQAAGLAYVISVLLSVASPFLKGVGAVELSVVYILGTFGYNSVESLAIALIYRTFEFWLPMLCGLFAFLVKGKALFLRLFPAFTIFLLGVINILSVVKPPVAARMQLLNEFVPTSTIHASNTLVIYLGVALIVTATFLIRGLRNAWWLAVFLTVLSLAGHLFRGLVWEECLLALLVLLCLFFTKRQYTARSSRRLVFRALRVALLTFVAVIVYGFVGFYFLEKRHFNTDFTRYQSIQFTLQAVFLQKNNLQPLTHFGKDFLVSMYVFSLGAWVFLLYAFVKPFISKTVFNREQNRALIILDKYGSSAVDFFKISSDKLFFFSKQYEAFVAYRVQNGFAVVLETPVCKPEETEQVLGEFTRYSKRAGLKPAYYRVDESYIPFFEKFNFKKLLIGQEAIVNVTTFDLAGRDKKSLRNALNSLAKKGYVTTLKKAPHNKEFIDSIKAISDEWLREYDRKEAIFSQGSFDEQLFNQDIIVTYDVENNPVAFLNIIPDFAPGECTYDLIRKTADAPGGCMDALIIELINYTKQQGKQTLNMGLAPMSGLEQASNTLEKVMKYAYEKIRRFRHYQGLRAFKEKYATQWVNKYLVYENDFDLLRLPVALGKAMKPLNDD